jgi:hypothetical protein
MHSTWRFERDPTRFELVEVLIDGERIDSVRIIRHGKCCDFSVLEELPSPQRKQLDLFGGE